MLASINVLQLCDNENVIADHFTYCFLFYPDSFGISRMYASLYILLNRILSAIQVFVDRKELEIHGIVVVYLNVLH
jgi:hypothetical protein